MREALQRLSMRLASPTGVLFAMPLVVVGLFAGLSTSGCDALRRASDDENRARFVAEADLLASQVAEDLAQVDPMLDRLRRIAREQDPDKPLPPVAHELMDLLRGRKGLAYVSLSFPDGTFQGAYLDPQGALRFQDSRLTPERTLVRRFREEGRNGLELVKEERTDYDPRTRGFYVQASKSEARTFTAPYAFYLSNQTGVTATEAVRVGGALRAVVTVDVDVFTLTQALARVPLPEGSKLLVVDSDGAVLSYPAAAAAIRGLSLPEGEVLRVRHLDDPELAAAVESGRRVSTVGAKETEHLSVVSRVPAPGVDWRVVMLVPTRVFVAPRKLYERRAALYGGVALVAALGLSALLAWNFVRVRRELSRAHQRALRAQAEARELGSYRLVRRLGQGGMGEVWGAEHRLLARRAAVKLIRLDGVTRTDEERREVEIRFRREAEALAELSSPHTIHLYDYGVAADGTLFLVTELLDGVDLETLVAESGPLPPARVCSLLIQALRSLVEAHEHGLVHRDIKPANLFLACAGSEFDVLKVLDFGLVRAAYGDDALAHRPTLAELRGSHGALREKITSAGQIFGTPEYMAPEQGLGPELGVPGEVDARTDLYALGCVAVFLLTGETLFAAESGVVHLMLHATETPRPLRERVTAHVPDAMVELVERCLAKRPEDRPKDAREALDTLLDVVFPEAERWTEQMSRAWWGMREALSDGGSDPVGAVLEHGWAGRRTEA